MKRAFGGIVAASALLAGLSWSSAAWSYALESLVVKGSDGETVLVNAVYPHTAHTRHFHAHPSEPQSRFTVETDFHDDTGGNWEVFQITVSYRDVVTGRQYHFAMRDKDPDTPGHQIVFPTASLDGVTYQSSSQSIQIWTRHKTEYWGVSWYVHIHGDNGPSTCRRTPAVRDAIVRGAGETDCQDVGELDLRGITALDYGTGKFTLETDSLKAKDFEGLVNVTRLDITLKSPTIKTIAPGTFSGLDGLEKLRLNGDGEDGGLTALGDRALEGMPRLRSIALSQHNDVASLGDSVFQGTQSLELVELFDLPSLDQMPSALLHGQQNLKDITLDTVPGLTAIPVGFFRDNPSLDKVRILDVGGLTTVPADLFKNSPRIRLLFFDPSGLTSVPDGFFEPLTMLVILELGNQTTLSADTAMDADIDPQDVSGTVSTRITLDGNPQPSPWGTNLRWAWKQVVNCTAADAAEVTTGAVTLTGADTATPSFAAGSTATTLYFRATVTPPGERDTFNLTAYDFSDTGCATVTITAMQQSAPSVSSVGITAPPGGDRRWDAGDAVEAVLTFDEAVSVDTTSGTPSVGLRLGAGTARTAAYASGSGTTALAFRYTVATGEGPYTDVLLDLNSLALNGGTIQSTASGADASLAHNGAGASYPRSVVPDTTKDNGPTARFSNVPVSHDGESAFEVELGFSAETGITSYATVRDALLEVTGATVESARRKAPGSNTAWVMSVRPSGLGDVTLTLPVRACTETNAVCAGNKPIVRAAVATIEGPPFTASFDGAPAEHDGSAFTVNVRMTVEPERLSYVTVRDALFNVSGGAISNVRRLTQGENSDWALTVAPEGYGAVTLALVATTDCAGTPGVCDSTGRKLVGPLSLTVQGPPTLSVADAEVEEAEGATLAFTVTLSRTVDETVSVAYATADGSATQGVDYTATSGTLTFAPGDTTKTVEVTVLDDAHDEGRETLTLTLSNATPARVKLADAEATGTITNTDPMPKAWMVRFGRTVGTHVVDALDARLGAESASHVTVGGMTLGGGGGAPHAEEDDPFALPEWTRSTREEEARTMSARELLLGSSFHLSSGRGAGGGPAFSAWGRIATSGFEAEEDDVVLDGDVTSGLVGFDAEWERALAGVMLSHSEGDGAYRLSAEKDGDEGTVESAMTGVYPYGSVDLEGSLSVWAIAGVGSGELTLVQRGERAMPADLSMRMAAGGVRGALLEERAGDAMTVRVKSDALWVGTKSADTAELAATEGDVTRLRLTLEAQRTFAAPTGGALTPSGEVGLRHDGGDAETGVGLEVGAGLAYRVGTLSIEGRVRTLLAHEEAGYEEWGASGTVRVAPDGSGRGLTLSVRPEWGATASATERLWGARDARALAGDTEYEAGRRVAVDTGYGFGAAGGVLTPFVGMTFESEAGRTLRGGATWALGEGIALKLEASRSAYADDADSALTLRGGIRF